MFAWAALGCVLELPLAQAAPCPPPAVGEPAPSESIAPCDPPPQLPSPLDVLLSGGGILGSFLIALPARRRRR
jgi:hypothetical protein